MNLLQASYQLFFERNPLPMLVYDVNTLRLLAANQAATRCYGHTDQQFLELHLGDIFHADEWPQLQLHLELPPSQRAARGLWRHRTRSGNPIHVDLETEDIDINGVQVRMLLVHDVTAGVPREDERQESRKQLSELANKLMTQEKDLVKRIAQAMHDQVGQTMAAIRMVHETMGMLKPEAVSPEFIRLDRQLEILIRQAIRQVRQVLIDLDPTLLDEQGLAAALDNELRNRSLTLKQRQTHIALDVAPNVAAVRWPTAVEYGAFMIAREAVENALRHARATTVSVRLSGGPLSLELTMIDNGVGFTGGDQHKLGHLGIASMLERAKVIGGSIEVGPGDTCGTCVTLHWQPSK